jgi:predicted metal-dependent HD superfamily phosphohydrolase
MSPELEPLLPNSGRIRREDVAAEIEKRYREPGRHYHNLEHAQSVAAKVVELGQKLDREELRAAILAAWFHDAVYSSRSKTNEEDSAVLATTRLLALGATQALADRVADLVMATKGHLPNEGDRAAAVLLDADLAILSASPAIYDQYALAIRREYAWVDGDIYRPQRALILESFLARSGIYFTSAMRKAGEGQARENLAREIAQLRDSIGAHVPHN